MQGRITITRGTRNSAYPNTAIFVRSALCHRNERILITGGAGSSGLTSANRLVELGHEVLCVDNTSRAPENIAPLLQNPRFESCATTSPFPIYVEVDLIFISPARRARPLSIRSGPTTQDQHHGRDQMGSGKTPENSDCSARKRGVRRSARTPSERKLWGNTLTQSVRAPAMTRVKDARRLCL